MNNLEARLMIQSLLVPITFLNSFLKSTFHFKGIFNQVINEVSLNNLECDFENVESGEGFQESTNQLALCLSWGNFVVKGEEMVRTRTE